jgi:hypothetical protein
LSVVGTADFDGDGRGDIPCNDHGSIGVVPANWAIQVTRCATRSRVSSIGDDVGTVIVDGKVCMEHGRIRGIDFADQRTRAQLAGERIWSGWANWDPLGRSGEEMSPFSIPRMN